jgi:hypothetical protein
MAVTALTRRGLELELPRLQIGELALTTDTNKLFIGTGLGNLLITTLTNKDIVDLWNNVESSSRLYGGVISDNGDGTVSVSAGSGLSKMYTASLDTVPPVYGQGQASDLALVNWDEVASLVLTDEADNYIYYDKYTDSILATINYNEVDVNNDFIIGRAYRSGVAIITYYAGQDAWNFRRRVQTWGREVQGMQPAKNTLIIGHSGQYLTITEGAIWSEAVNRFPIPAFDSSGSDRFTYWFRDGLGGFTKVENNALLSNEHYDNNSGTLEVLGENGYSVNWVYVLTDGSVHVVYGTESYTLLGTKSAIIPSNLPGLIAAYGLLIGKTVIKKDDLELASSNTAFVDQFPDSDVDKIRTYVETVFAKDDWVFTIAHGLGTSNVAVVLMDYDTKELITIPVEITDINTIQVKTGKIGTVNRINIVVMG